MALPNTASGTKLLIQLGDGGGSETFAEPCGLITKAIASTADVNTIVIPDCSDPDAPAWQQREITAIGREITGSGVLATTALGTWEDWFVSGDAKNIRVTLDVSLANGGGYWGGAAKLTAFTITGERGNKVQIEVTIQSDGVFTWTDAAA